MIDLILKTIYLLLPAYMANMAPVIFAKLNWLNLFSQPVDAGHKIGRSFIFGPGKTWRGILAAVILGIITAAVQSLLYTNQFFYDLSLINYPEIFWLFGFLAGLGAILGDLGKSFLKRRIDIASGRSWPVFDQLDFIAGFLVFTYWLVRPEIAVVITMLVLTLILHPLVNLLAFILRIKKVWW